MNPPTPTPRTDAAWRATFEANQLLSERANAASQMRDECAALERKLTAERDELRSEMERLRSDRDCEKRLRKDAEEFRENAIARAMKAEADLTAERERVRVLREALENLRDEQNGAPLCTREEQWTQAMEKADAALAATEEDAK